MALALGRTVEELLATTSQRELNEWAVFYGLDPWGDQRGDMRNALLCQMVSAACGGKAKLSDFMLFDRPRRKRRQTPEQMYAVARAFAQAHNRYVEQQRGKET